MRRVCIIINRLAVGGAEYTALAQAQEFCRRGCKVSVITLNPELPKSLMPLLPSECERTGIKFHSIFDVRALRALIRALRARRPDIIITHMWYANTVGRVAAKTAGFETRTLAFEQNVYDRLSLKSRTQFFVDRLLQHWCKYVVAASKAIGESLVRCGINKKRIRVIYDAVDLSRITGARPAALRSELSLGNAFIYLFVGRLTPQKGVDVLLRSFARQGAGVLLIAGDGPERGSLEKLVGELGIEKNTFFLGVRGDVPSLMRAADCFVLASRLEGLGLVLVEAIASGLPVVASNVDGIPEVVEDGATGMLVAPEDVEAFAGAMRRAREQPLEFSPEDGLRGMEKRFSIQKNVDDILACFA